MSPPRPGPGRTRVVDERFGAARPTCVSGDSWCGARAGSDGRRELLGAALDALARPQHAAHGALTGGDGRGELLGAALDALAHPQHAAHGAQHAARTAADAAFDTILFDLGLSQFSFGSDDQSIVRVGGQSVDLVDELPCPKSSLSLVLDSTASRLKCRRSDTGRTDYTWCSRLG